MEHGTRLAWLAGSACAFALAVIVMTQAGSGPEGVSETRSAESDQRAFKVHTASRIASPSHQASAQSDSASPFELTASELAAMLADQPSIDAPERTHPAMGAAAQSVPESAFAVDRSTPVALLYSLLAARSLGDQAALVRHSLPLTLSPELTALDLRWAHRAYLMSSSSMLWERVAEALEQERFELSADPTSAEQVTLVLNVGGALGEYSRSFIRLGDGWYLLTQRHAEKLRAAAMHGEDAR